MLLLLFLLLIFGVFASRSFSPCVHPMTAMQSCGSMLALRWTLLIQHLPVKSGFKHAVTGGKIER